MMSSLTNETTKSNAMATLDCCICLEPTDAEWYFDEASDDEREQHNICPICKAYVCSWCRYDWCDKLTRWNKVKAFTCPICRTIDWKHYFSEEILWWIKHNDNLQDFGCKIPFLKDIMMNR